MEFEIFCHYLNNEKEFLYEEECIYIQKDSENCRFGGKCERQMCMYKHAETDEDDDESVCEIKNQDKFLGMTWSQL